METLPHCETLLLEKQGPTLHVTINRPGLPERHEPANGRRVVCHIYRNRI